MLLMNHEIACGVYPAHDAGLAMTERKTFYEFISPNPDKPERTGLDHERTKNRKRINFVISIFRVFVIKSSVHFEHKSIRKLLINLKTRSLQHMREIFLCKEIQLAI